jgi:hypothetical protein
MQQISRTISASAYGVWVLLAHWAIPACAPARVSESKGPDAAGWIEITCRQSQDECARKAQEVCSGPYAVRESDGRFYDGPGGAFYSGSMQVRCGAPEAPATEPAP